MQTRSDMERPVEALVVASSVISKKGWEAEEPEELTQKEIFFTAKTKVFGYEATIEKISEDVISLELLVQLVGTNYLLRDDFMRLLNYINRYILGTIYNLVDVDEDVYLLEHIAHRSELHFDPMVGVTENQVESFINKAVTTFDMCLPHITTFLATKPKAVLDENGIIDFRVVISPEDTVAAIFQGSPVGYA